VLERFRKSGRAISILIFIITTRRSEVMYMCVRVIGFASVFYGFSAKHAALRRKSKYWLARNRYNVGRHVYSRTIASVS